MKQNPNQIEFIWCMFDWLTGSLYFINWKLEIEKILSFLFLVSSYMEVLYCCLLLLLLGLLNQYFTISECSIYVICWPIVMHKNALLLRSRYSQHWSFSISPTHLRKVPQILRLRVLYITFPTRSDAVYPVECMKKTVEPIDTDWSRLCVTNWIRYHLRKIDVEGFARFHTKEYHLPFRLYLGVTSEIFSN